jgi:hypothetical protein
LKIDTEMVVGFIIGALILLTLWGISNAAEVRCKERVRCEEVLGGVYFSTEEKCLKIEEIPLENE